jgi:hypothetical protein
VTGFIFRFPFPIFHLSLRQTPFDQWQMKRWKTENGIGKGYPIGPVNRTLEIQGVTGRKMPRFLDKSRAACKGLGG